jgi:predicted nucleic acid-binding protein
MNVVDSSAWIEYFIDGPNSDHFVEPIQDKYELVVPSVCIYEVFKKFLLQRSERDAFEAAAQMKQGAVIDLEPEIAIQAAKLSLELRLPFADAIILATARSTASVLWTQDDHFKGIPGVRYFAAAPKGG